MENESLGLLLYALFAVPRALLFALALFCSLLSIGNACNPTRPGTGSAIVFWALMASACLGWALRSGA